MRFLMSVYFNKYCSDPVLSSLVLKVIAAFSLSKVPAKNFWLIQVRELAT